MKNLVEIPGLTIEKVDDNTILVIAYDPGSADRKDSVAFKCDYSWFDFVKQQVCPGYSRSKPF